MTVLEIVRSVRDIGFDLRKGRFNGAGWKAYKIEKMGDYTIIQYIPEEIYSGYATGLGSQMTSSAGFSKKGIVVEITDGKDVYHDQAFQHTDFETQQGIWRQLISEINNIVYPTSSYKKITTQVMENPFTPSGQSWRVGDVVNVSRPTQDGGGFALGHVLRMYPTSVLVEWPPDALHPFSWTTEENKTALLFVTHDADFSKRKEFSAENYYHPLVNPRQSDIYIENELAIENEMEQAPPNWTKFVTPLSMQIYRQNPLPKSQDVWGEHDALMNYTNRVMAEMFHVQTLEKYSRKVLSKSKGVESEYGS